MSRLFAAFILCLLAFPTWAKDPVTLTVGMNTWFGNGTVFAAKDQKFYNQTNIDIKVIDDVTAMSNSYRAGKIDIVCLTSDAAALQFANGMTGKAIVMTDHSNGADGLIARAGIISVKDLKGKTVGFTRGFASQYLLGKILQDAGLSMNDIKQVPFDDPGLAAQGLFSGKVDAAVTWEPFLTQATSKKLGTVIKNTRDYPQALPNVFVVSDKALAEHPQEVKDFITGIIKALDFAKQKPDQYAAVTAKGFGVTVPEVVDGLKGLKFGDKDENQKFFCAKEPTFATIFDDAAQFWLSQGLIKALPQKGATYVSNMGCDLFSAQ